MQEAREEREHSERLEQARAQAAQAARAAAERARVLRTDAHAQEAASRRANVIIELSSGSDCSPPSRKRPRGAEARSSEVVVVDDDADEQHTAKGASAK